MSRDCFKFYWCFYDAIKHLPCEVRGRLYEAICKYGLYRHDSELCDFERAVFAPIREVLEADWQEYELQNKLLNKGGKRLNKGLNKQNKTLNKGLISLNNAYLRENKAYLSLNKSINPLNKRQNE